MSRRVAIFGGSFDPVHLGHLHLARTAMDHFGFDEVRFMLAPQAPHKPEAEGHVKLDVEGRLALLEAALADEPRFVVDRTEVQQGGSSYTFDTLSTIHGNLPEDSSLFFLIGTDSLKDLPKWHRAAELVDRFTFVTIPRDERHTQDNALFEVARAFPRDVVEKLQKHFVNVAPLPISSTEVRRRVRQGIGIEDSVPEAVARLIRERGYYGAPAA